MEIAGQDSLANITICDNPLVSHNFAVIRDKNTPPEIFRACVNRIARIIISKAFENIPLVSQKIETPLMETEVNVIDNKAQFIIAPILRAGLIFSDIALEFLPIAKVHHIGLYRDEKTLLPVSYYNNLPKIFSNPSDVYVYLLDPMLATGGSAVAGIKLFANLNIPQKNITFISLISAPEGISKISSEFPDIKQITGVVDTRLNSIGYIIPGLGDAGDRAFNT